MGFQIESNKRRLFLSTISALINQVIVGIAGLILPIYIIRAFGSGVNGLLSSITQYLSVVSFMDFGIGAVVQSSLYKPLAEKDINKLSQVMVAAEKFYHKIAIFFLIYVAIMIILFPISVKEYDWGYIVTLILILAISNFTQYFFGAASSALVLADQRSYIQYSLHSLTVVLNLIASVVLIYYGASIHIVKLATTLTYIIRPICVWLYTKTKYKIDKNVKIEGEPIKQKRNGFLQHLSSVVLDNTDVMVLTALSTLENVSIYSVYYNILKLIKTTFESIVNGLQALMGNLWARREKNKIDMCFDLIEWGIHTIVVYFFFLVGVLIIPFVFVYTKDITDVNYINQPFAIILTVAISFQCIRLPYMIVVKAAGHYRETQMSALLEMVINIIVSILAVYSWGLPGVALGTLLAMVYRSTYLALYTYRVLLNKTKKKLLFQIVVDVLEIASMYIITRGINFTVFDYFQWFLSAVYVALLCLIVIASINIVFMRRKICLLFSAITKKGRRYN